MNHPVRSARVSDALEIARLSAALGYPVEPDDITLRLDMLLVDPAHLVLVAEATAGTGLLGWLAGERRVSLESGLRFEIVGLIVDGSVRRAGVGRALVRAFERWASGQGGGSLVVRSNVLRSESHAFYESLGYGLKKRQHVYTKSLSA